jgi:hypothetical protein
MGGGADRLVARTDVPVRVMDEDLERGKRLRNWGSYRLTLDRKRHLEDMPWVIVGGYLFVASERLRELLEQHAPRQIQFLPIHATFRAKPVTDVTYWVMNILNLLDCVDDDRSEWRPWPGEPHRKWYDRIELDAARVPKHIQIFRPSAESSAVLVRRELAETIIAAGITGCIFDGVNIISD